MSMWYADICSSASDIILTPSTAENFSETGSTHVDRIPPRQSGA
ncbi:hypothetical protein BN903_16 [Halorubrum sp. AJ67]|nr:hypothetical protein BN903_16 [Halorubrum sp. AJ67]